MAIDKMIPEIYVNEILLGLATIATALALCNTDYEGEIQEKGDTVHIVSPVAMTVRDYETDDDIIYQALSDTEKTLTIDKGSYIAGIVKDSKQAVSPFDLANIYSEDGKYQLSDAADMQIYKIMAEGAHADNTIDTITLTAANIIQQIKKARTMLSKKKVSRSLDSFIVLTPDEIELVSESPQFTKATDISDDLLVTGQVGKIAGFRVIESMNVYTQDPAAITTGNPVHKLLPFGVTGATTFANAIPAESVETGRSEKKFGTWFRALHLYGCKVIHDTRMGVIKVDTGEVGTL